MAGVDLAGVEDDALALDGAAAARAIAALPAAEEAEANFLTAPTADALADDALAASDAAVGLVDADLEVAATVAEQLWSTGKRCCGQNCCLHFCSS